MNQTKGQTFSMERAAEIVEEAFHPLDCVARTPNSGSQIEFEVTQSDRTLLKHTIPSSLANKDYTLRSQIMAARRLVEELGIRLDPWEMPSE
jgi:hypothetical protein